jgi:aminomethyltransferase
MKTALYPKHVLLNGKMVEFAGWEMPLQYRGVLAEHRAVRTKAGLFDVSHMGRISVTGPEAEPFLEFLSTNKIAGKKNFSATYTVLSNERGGTVDDVIVYKRNEKDFFIVVNAGNRQKDLAHLKRYAASYDVQVQDHYRDEGILALQGPLATHIGRRIFSELLSCKPMHFVDSQYQGMPVILSATGYTGAGGFEVYATSKAIVELWDRFLEEGATEGIEPAGLGARDTLRLEMGYALYGHELSETIAPNESVSAWTIKWDKGDFLGKFAMQKIEESPHKRIELGLLLLEKGIAREGCAVYKGDRKIGEITSGTFSPTLNNAIALAIVEAKYREGNEWFVEIRQHRTKAKVVPLPFIPASS